MCAISFVFFNTIEVELELVEDRLESVLVAVVNDKCDRHHIKNVFVQIVTGFLQVEVELVLLGDAPVELKMVDYIILAMLAQKVKSD